MRHSYILIHCNFSNLEFGRSYYFGKDEYSEFGTWRKVQVLNDTSQNHNVDNVLQTM